MCNWQFDHGTTVIIANLPPPLPKNRLKCYYASHPPQRSWINSARPPVGPSVVMGAMSWVNIDKPECIWSISYAANRLTTYSACGSVDCHEPAQIWSHNLWNCRTIVLQALKRSSRGIHRKQVMIPRSSKHIALRIELFMSRWHTLKHRWYIVNCHWPIGNNYTH